MDQKNALPEVAKQLDNHVLAVLGAEKLNGFERAYQMAEAVKCLQGLLTPEYMKPIMALQGNKLGFRTDKDTKGGYGEDVVKNCLIEAVLIGLQPTGNQFNIIAGNCYPTKEGLGYLLANFSNLKYTINTGLPRINPDKTSCAFAVTIKWKTLKEDTSEVVEIPIKIDQWASVDSMVGKATRKARAWLYSKVTGTEITDGEAEDAKATIISTKVNGKSNEEKEFDRVLGLIEKCNTLDELNNLKAQATENNTDLDMYTVYFDARAEEIKNKKK